MGGERDAILSRRAKFVAAALAATGLTVIVHEPPAEVTEAAAQQPYVCLSVARRPQAPEDQARDALRAGDFARAAQLYRGLLDLQDRQELLAEYAEACEGANDFRAARDVYANLLARRADAGLAAPDLEEKLRVAESKLGNLVVTSNDPNMKVLLDGVQVQASGTAPLRVNPGVHAIKVIGSLGDEQTQNVIVRSGATVETAFTTKFDATPRACLVNMDVREVTPPESRPPSGCGCHMVGKG